MLIPQPRATCRRKPSRLPPIAPHQFEKAEGVADGVDAADFIGINGADGNRGDPATGATGEDKHFGFVVEALGASQETRDNAAMDHAKAALRIGNVLAAGA